MRVTRFQYPMETCQLQKIDLAIERCTQKNPKRDATILIEGSEGEGKTTMSIAIGYYVSEKTGRVFNHTRLFFDVQKMIEFGQSTDNEIIIWDEPSAQAMSGDSGKRIVRDLYRFLNMCRNKRHFIMINMSYFNLFKDYIVWQRPLCMFHVYSRDEKQAGRFVFIKKKNLEKLWYDWHRKKQRNYRKYCSKYIRGTFPDILNPDYKYNVLSEFDFNAYEDSKNDATASIGKEKPKEEKIDLRKLRLQYNVSRIPKLFHIKVGDLAKVLGMDRKAIQEWAKLPLKYNILLEKSGF